MFSGVDNSKEKIRSRMLKHAVNYWNIKNVDDLDPIVKLLMEALSTELYNLGNDIKDTEVRLLEKIAQLLAPDFLTCPNPAHAILHAMPVEAVEMIHESSHFYTQKKISSRQDDTLDKNIDVFFTPVDKIMLSKINIAFLASDTHLFACDLQFNKQPIAETISGKRLENNVLWMGVFIDEQVQHLNDCHFYFDWKNMSPDLSKMNYQLLSLTKWSINDEAIDSREGIPYEAKKAPAMSAGNVSLEYDLLSLIEKDIKDYYDRKYISIRGEQLNHVPELRQPFPPSFSIVFPDKDLQKLNKPLAWFKVIFPAALPPRSLDELCVYTNTFPVLNRQLVNQKYRLNGGSNILPLKTNELEQFLSVRSLSDDSHSYRSTPFRKMEEAETGTYTVRNGGVERFDERNAKEFISYLLELLRSESSAFTAYGNDFIASTLREMNQRIALMEQKTRVLTNITAEIPHYIVAKPHEGNTAMYVEYWTTIAEAGNFIRSGTRLQEYNGQRTMADSLVLITTSVGGKNRLKPEERVNAFRYGLITRNRIVTKEDIRNFFFQELGERISTVDVERGFEMSPHPQKGFIRTIDITLTAKAANPLNGDSWQPILEQLKSKLQSRSGIGNSYRIFLNNNG